MGITPPTDIQPDWLKDVNDELLENDVFDPDELDEFLEEEPVLELPMRIIKPCRTQLRLRIGDQTRILKVYIDPGAASSFINEPTIGELPNVKRNKTTESFSGAINGKEYDSTILKVVSDTNEKNISVHILPQCEWTITDADLLLGLPSCIDLQLTMTMEPNNIVLNWKALGLKQTIQIQEKEPTVHKILNVEKVVHPTKQDWGSKLSDLPDTLRKELIELLEEFKKQFWISGALPAMKGVEYSIKYSGGPFIEPMIPLSKADREYIIPIFEDQVKQGMLVEITDVEEISKLQHVSNMFLKNEADKKRPCTNYRKLNRGTIKTNMPLPNKEALISKFCGADFYITLDAKSAYNQMVVAQDTQKLLTFVVPGINGRPRYFYPTRANFGTSNMPGQFQQVSGGYFDDIATSCYIDDVTIMGEKGKEKQALGQLRKVLQRAKEKGITFAYKKAFFFKKQIKMLGEIISKEGRRPNPARVRDLKMVKLPRTRRQLKAYLGLYNFLAPSKRHCMTKDIAKLNEYTSRSIKYDKQKIAEAFERSKLDLCKWILLCPWSSDEPTFVFTDSSDQGMGVVVMQVQNGNLQAIAIMSKRWPKVKKAYSAYHKEGLAIITGMKRFEYMLRHSEVIIVTDSENCVKLFTNWNWNDIPSIWFRWRNYLAQTFRVSILHIPGRLNIAADVLSRQEFTIQSIDVDDEVFFTPLLRRLYNKQRADSELNSIITELQSKEGSTKPSELPKAYYFMENGLLKQKHQNFGTQIVVPKSMVKTILTWEHDLPSKGHPGYSYMRHSIKTRYYWNNMDKDILHYVTSCTACQLIKSKVTKRGVTNAIRHYSSLFQCFSLDLIDMGTISESYRYILVIMDYYSGFIVLVNLRNKKAANVVKALYRVFSTFGPPATLLSDRGKEFLNGLMQDMTKRMGVAHSMTYSYYPQGNAKNERSHQVIESALRAVKSVQANPSSWHLYTDTVMYMYNTRENPETGISPYEVVFGLKPRPLHNTTPFLEYNHEDMVKLRDAVRSAYKDYQLQKLRKRFNLQPPKLKVGDLVILTRNFPLRGKHLPKGQGPFKVIETIGTTGYKLQHTITGKVMDSPVPRVQLSKFVDREEDGDQVMQSPDANKEVEEEEEEIAQQEKEVSEERDLVNKGEKVAESNDLELDANTKGKNKRTLNQLKAYNQPTVKQTREIEPEVGAMVIMDEGNKKIRIGEIRELFDNELTIQWYGTNTPKSLSRSRWKYYPGWENDDGDIQYKRMQGFGIQRKVKPAECMVSRSNILTCFQKLTLSSTIPEDVLLKINKYTL